MSEPFHARKLRNRRYATRLAQRFVQCALRRSVPRMLAILAVTLAASGCAAVTRHGDAKRRDGSSASAMLGPDRLLFPDVSLARATTYRFRVRDLPSVIYPLSFRFDVPGNEDDASRSDQPWRSCTLRASLSTPDGRTFFTRTFDFSKDWKGGRWPDRKARRAELYFSFLRLFPHNEVDVLPKHLSYDLTIEIIRPSRRASDKLRIHAFDTYSNRG